MTEAIVIPEEVRGISCSASGFLARKGTISVVINMILICVLNKNCTHK